MSLTRRHALAGGSALAGLAVSHRARAAGPTIKIGVLTDLSGPYRDNSGPTTVLAAKQAVEDFNPSAHGFIAEVVAADHQQKPDVGAGIARQWYDRDGVDTIADVNNTAIALAVRQLAEEKNKTVLISGAASVELTGKYCSANTVHFNMDTWFGPHMTASAILKDGGKDWYLIVADYTFGHSLETSLKKMVTDGGGRIVGTAAYPFPGTTDFSSYLVAAQASGAKVIGLCNAGGDMENCIKQAAEFGLAQSGIRMAAVAGFITEAKSMGLQAAQGLLLPGIFYWNLNDRTRAFAKRIVPKTPDNWPNDLHVACYGSVMHYLKGVAALGVEKAKTSGTDMIAWMKANPTDDDCFGKGWVRADGRFMTTGYLYQVKKPSESTGPWDVFNVLAAVPAEQAFRPLSEGGCPLVKA